MHEVPVHVDNYVHVRNALRLNSHQNICSCHSMRSTSCCLVVSAFRTLGINHLDLFIFLQISKQDDHEFYELVNAYFRGRHTLALAVKEYEVCLLL